ncbi:MAG: DUF1553 domain-containing protein [Verrucomicrobia bacterium]|nr:DUF1553 domain-containing protein [Verrucomicrobiota bacterium]
MAAKTPAKNTDAKAAKKPAAPSPVAFAADASIKMPRGVAKGEDFALTFAPVASPVASVRIDIPKGAIPAGSAASITARFGIVDAKGKERAVAFHLADASHREPRYSGGVEATDINKGWSLKMPDADVHAVWLLDLPAITKADEKFVIHFESNAALTFRASLSPLAHDDPLKVTAPETLLAAKDARPSPANFGLFLHSRGGDRALVEQSRMLIAAIRSQTDGYAWSMVTQAAKPLTVRILPRGNFLDETGPVVLPTTPSFLPGLRTSTEQKRLTRLDLADWITSKDNPITARTVMNRLWQIFHGTGLSAGLDDLGSQGELPSHPELLEWLALEFRDKGWDVKKMVRLMVTSRTYRQSSSLRPDLKETDPNNRLLASQNPRRLDAEFVRDNALFVAGLLNVADVGGPSVKPYQPDGYLLNDPTFVEAARAMAARLLALPSGERLGQGFRLAMGRDIKSAERAPLEKLIADQTTYYKSNPAEAAKLLKVGFSQPSAGDPAELAAWTQACRVLLNSHEAITRY